MLFSIQTKTGILLVDVILNKADAFFNFNALVETDIITIIVNVLAINGFFGMKKMVKK